MTRRWITPVSPRRGAVIYELFDGNYKQYGPPESIQSLTVVSSIAELATNTYCVFTALSGFSYVVTMSDTICGSRVNMSDTHESISFGNMLILNVFFGFAEDVCSAFNVLKEGGKVIVPLGPQFFSPMYSSVEDRFGVRWQLITEQQGEAQ